MVISTAVFLAFISAQQAAPHPPVVFYVPERVYDTAAGAFVDFEVMLARLSKADVVFVGEQHDDPNTHRLEAAILDGLHRRKVTPVLSLEMFERDAQRWLNDYFAEQIGEEEMLKNARPWPRYATDYRRMVEMARERKWTVVAANVPRRLAADVSKNGKEAIGKLSETDRAMIARELQCPPDDYSRRFAESMSGHPAGTQTPEQQQAMVERFYWAQCVKDETMAEAIAAAYEKKSAAGPIVHYNGAFHSDFGLGTAERVRRRLPGKKTMVVTMIPVEDLDTVAPAGEDLKRADYLVYTVK
jgi:uncharacterized iron-regulated protein